MESLILVQFVDNDEQPTNDALQVPSSISLEHLRQIHNVDSSYSLFINGHQITTTLASCLEKLNISKEETVLIKTFKDAQTIRPALFCNSSFSGHEQAVLKVRVINNKICVTAGGDGTLRFWDLATKTAVQIIKISDHWVLSLDVYKDYVLAGSMDGNLCLINSTNFEMKNFKNHSKGISSVSISKIREQIVLASAGRDNKVFLLTDSGKIIHSYLHSGPVDCVLLRDNLLISSGRQGEMKIYNIHANLEPVTFVKDLRTHIKRINDIKFQNNLLISASDDCKVNIHSSKSNFSVIKQLHHKNVVVSVALSENNQFVATASFDKTVRLWDLSSGNCLATYFHVDAVYKVIFSSNLLISIGKDKSVKIFCTKTKKILSDMVCGDEIFDIDVIGRIMICGCRDRKVYFFA